MLPLLARFFFMAHLRFCLFPHVSYMLFPHPFSMYCLLTHLNCWLCLARYAFMDKRLKYLPGRDSYFGMWLGFSYIHCKKAFVILTMAIVTRIETVPCGSQLCQYNKQGVQEELNCYKGWEVCLGIR